MDKETFGQILRRVSRETQKTVTYAEQAALRQVLSKTRPGRSTTT